ncbi:MAG: sensor histidine kinase [Proteobacteria bacterium]|nr:sensor histidine kinase [Pseudomonadota bacterium]MBU1715894.1 sensor histidine kinase [Pseudomonadota bacterium]
MVKKLLFGSLLMVVVGIGLLHFFTPGHLGFYHDTYRRLSYFPIVMGGIWFGVWGGLALAVLSSIAFIPHLILYMGHGPQAYHSELMEIVLYLAAGLVTGMIASREARLRVKYQQLSEKLEKSYAKLHDDSALLLELEEQLGASQKLSALGQLSASLAHEIKNPLSSIKGTAEILLDEFAADHPKREFGDILLKEIDRLNATVNEVLQYSRGQILQRGEVVTEPLTEVLLRVGRLLESYLKKKAIIFNLHLISEAGSFGVDGGKLSQVFLNIILNAIDAVPEKGRIEIEVRVEGKGLVVEIADNGPGVAPTERENIFKPFVSGKEQGTGLGLPISSKIVESYGGEIRLAESRLGGASFAVFLPPFSVFSSIAKFEDDKAVAGRRPEDG